MTQRFGLSKSKGQSAIEYLMTYGWMLLVVAIVGGAIFSIVQDNQQACEKQITDVESSEQGFGVADFTTTSNSLNIQFENNQRDTVNLTSVTVSGVEVLSGNQQVGFGDTYTLETNQFEQADNCATLDIAFSYEQGDLPSEASGQLQDQMAESTS